jgi:predicted DsbA family dithiol-disulfide isomerase
VKTLRIDFVSDVVCPWCVIGLKALEAALARAGDVATAQIHFQPFELNPDMPPEGQNVAEHIAQKYGADPERSRGTRDLIRTTAAEFGFAINSSANSRIWNTFDAHRLLYWAALAGRQPALKLALFEAYFTQGQNPGNPDVLAAAAVAAGLDAAAACEVLASDRYGDEVRRDAAFWRAQGIAAVPAIVIDQKYLITGAQPAEAFEKAIRRIAAEG